MLLHISRSAAEQALWLLKIGAFAKYSEDVLEEMVKFNFKCDVLVYPDCYIDDFSFGRHVQECILVQERMQPQLMTIGDIQEESPTVRAFKGISSKRCIGIREALTGVKPRELHEAPKNFVN